MLVKPGCYLKGILIAHKKYKNRILSILAIVTKDYEGGLISLQQVLIFMILLEVKNISQRWIA